MFWKKSALQAVFSREGFTVRRMPGEHAGGKWQLRYQSASGQGGILEVDVNFVFRVPLWPPKVMASRPVGVWQATDIQVLDIHELAAGKLAALLSRKQARDLFDCSHLFRTGVLETGRLRLAFVLYGAMNRRDWRTVAIDEVSLEINPELLSADEDLQDRIRRHPLLEWKALNVREFIKNQ